MEGERRLRPRFRRSWSRESLDRPPGALRRPGLVPCPFRAGGETTGTGSKGSGAPRIEDAAVERRKARPVRQDRSRAPCKGTDLCAVRRSAPFLEGRRAPSWEGANGKTKRSSRGFPQRGRRSMPRRSGNRFAVSARRARAAGRAGDKRQRSGRLDNLIGKRRRADSSLVESSRAAHVALRATVKESARQGRRALRRSGPREGKLVRIVADREGSAGDSQT